MILEEATFEAYGYYSTDWKLHSHKPIIAACELCGEFKITSNDQYYAFCHSCATNGRKHSDKERHKQSDAQRGNKRSLGCEHTKEQNSQHSKAMNGNKSALGSKHTREWKRKNAERMKGNKYGHGNKGKIATEEAKRNMRLNQVDKRGENGPNYKGGHKLAWIRQSAKRRQLGHIALNPYFEDCGGHHFTHNFVIYIPKGLHKSVYHNLKTGQGMKAINALALDFLVNGF